jgi:phage virion morphogenesis protein
MGSMVEIKTDEIKKLAAKINAFALSPSKKQKLLSELGGEIVDQTIERFDTKIDPEGDPWRALTEAYKKSRRKKNKVSGGILVREGSLQKNTGFQLQGSDTILVGSPMEYADYHQNAKDPKRLRKFLGLSVQNIEDLQDAVDVFMRRQTA